MKHLKLFFALFAMLALGVGNAWGQDKTVSWTATTNSLGSAISTVNGTATGTIKTGDFVWNYTRTLTSLKSGKTDYVQMSNGYMQCGSSNAINSLKFQTSNIPGTIKSVAVDCASYQGKHNISITVGGVTYLTKTAVPTWSNNKGAVKTGTGTSSGEIVISFTDGTRALYVKSITVVYEEGTTDPTCTTITPTLSYSSTSLLTGQIATPILGGNDGNGKVTYSTSDANVATVDANGNVTAKGGGTATITANIDANGEYCEGTATAKITVTPLIFCSEVYNLADDATFVLKEFVVTYVNGKYSYIKDNTGYGLIFNNAGSYGLKSGDQVAAAELAGKKDTYNGLVEIIPTSDFADLEITSGTAPAPEVMNALPVKEDMNKYVKFEDVTFASTAFSSKKVTGKINAGNITFYDQFATNATFNTSKKYDVIGAVSIYNSTIQVNFISAEEVAEPTLNVKITDADFGKVAINDSHERTLTLNGSLLTKPVELTIEGNYFTLASNSITPTDGSISEAKIKITYKPTVEGTHTATLKITSDELAEQTITLQGQAVQQHTVHFFVNGEEDETLAKKVLSGEKLTEIPTATSCDPLEYPTFIGWSDSEITGTTDVEPTDLLDLNTTITADCNYYAVFAKETTTSSSSESATMAYGGTSTTNMKDGNNASTVGLDEALFTITSDKGGQNNHVGLNKAGDIRLYANKADGNGNILTIAMAEGYTITQVSLSIKQQATFVVKANGQSITGTDNVYDINHSSCSIQNTTTGATTQLHLNSITISYTTSTISNEYLTTCESATPTYTVTYNLDGGESTCETSVVVEQDGEITLCAAPTKTGHTFLKWKDQNGDEYNAEAIITVSENLQLTAQWQKDSYKVTWMSLGNEVSSANVEYNEQPTKPADPTYTCGIGTKYFAGWTTEEIDGIGIPTNLYVDNLPAVTEAITYYAVFASKSAEAITTTSTLINTENLGQYKAGTAIDDQGETWNYYAGGGSEENINLRNNTGESSYIESPKFTGIVQSISAYVKNGSTSARKVYLRSTATASPTEGDLGETTIAGSNNSNVTFTIANGKSFNQFYIQVSGGLQFNNIVVTSMIAEGAYVDYITSCEALEVSIEVNEKVEFEPIKVEKTSTKNLAIATSNFDGTLEFEISGKDATFFTYGTYSGGELPLTYQPTEGGNHEATLTITAGQVEATVQLIGAGVEYTAGIWELVTDASTLSVDDQIVIVAKDEDYALSTTQNSNNRGQAEVEKNTSNNTIAFGDDVQVLTLHAGKDEGTFALYAANYLSDGVKKNGYLYAASTTANHLKTRNNLEDNANNYWTISVTEGVATIKAKSNSKNWLMYNSSSKIFSCYDSGQSDVQIYKKKTYTRTVTPGNYGTICLPYGSTEYSGATFFEIAYQEPGKVYIDEVTTLLAGVPYIFQAKSSKLSVTYEGTPDVAKSKNGLYGTFTEIADVAAYTLNKGYILTNNLIRFCLANCNVPANRAYIVLDDISEEQTPAPVNRRRVGMNVQGENETTGFEDLFTTEAPAKVIEDGQLIIIRDGVKYNVQGQKL